MTGKKKANRQEPSRRVRLEDDDIGYGKPPRAHQFKPGKSGNPKGRPKGIKNEMTIMRELLEQKVEINVRGRPKRVTLHEALYLRVLEDGLKGSLKSVGFLLGRYQQRLAEQAGHSDEPDGDDKAIIDAFIAKLGHGEQ